MRRLSEAEMNREQVLDRVRVLSRKEKIEWLLRLGFSLTETARDAYPSVTPGGNIQQLVGMNEMHRHLYQELLHIERGDNWGIEHLLDTLHDIAKNYGVLAEFRSTINSSLS